MPNTILALTILAVVIQQLQGVIRSALAWNTLDDAGRKDLIVKGIGLVLGIVFAAIVHFNLVPDGVLPADAPIWALYGISGIAVGLGVDFALGLVNVGKSAVQVVRSQAEKVAAAAQVYVARAEQSLPAHG